MSEENNENIYQINSILSGIIKDSKVSKVTIVLFRILWITVAFVDYNTSKYRVNSNNHKIASKR